MAQTNLLLQSYTVCVYKTSIIVIYSTICRVCTGNMGISRQSTSAVFHLIHEKTRCGLSV